ncbi:hypothetical protein SAMN05216371_3850 [Streptomyces sp. TLI_053]|uniref:hypothetical protein n=1 Tax=Streptomyces sp. TLI_053 TaxID=1855352 RepID=UPI00087ADD22|nr:hypothetical protein [Streptomyces sp. TLI_053]SDT69741.1 hypothetical protein SAMN05216371_3850 [Streptomyces sp. TLI_053]
MPHAIASPYGDDGPVAGVHFTAGRATVDELGAGARLYFLRHEYQIEQLDDTDEQGPTGDDPPPPTTAKGRSRAKEGAAPPAPPR